MVASVTLAISGVQPEAKFVTFHCENGYTTSVLLALKHDGRVLSAEHSYPLRSVVPKRYAWKSPKWLRGIEFMADDKLGFWERYGYNNNADFWEEERFA